MGNGTIEVDPSNAEQLAAWDGGEGAYWATHAERFDRALAAHHHPFMAAAELQGADRVLDVGCGTGETTRDAARIAVGGHVLGVDLSSAMLEHARRQAEAEGVTNVSFLQADAQIHPFEPAAFDVVIARTAAMFFGDKPAAFANLRRALGAGGRLVLLNWQPLEGNEWLREIATAMADGREPRIPPTGVGPLSLATPDTVRSLLADAGFDDVSLEGHEGPMWFGKDGADAQQFLVGLNGWMLEGLDDAGRARALDALLAICTAHETPEGVTFASATWITTATAAA